MQNIINIYPFNLARDVFSSEEEAGKIYLPGIYAALATLTEREQDILIQRYSDKLTLQECSKIHGVTKERIRQIEARAFRKLRHPVRTKMFKGVPIAELDVLLKEHQKLLKEHELLVKTIEQRATESASHATLVAIGKLAVKMQTPVAELNLSTRPCRALMRAGKETLRDVAEMTDKEFSQVRNLGKKSQEEVVNMLKTYGLDIRRTES